MNDMTIYCFDGWRLDVGQRRLLNPNGDNVHITNRDFDILVMFCEHPKQLVPRGSLAARSDGKAPTRDRAADCRIARIRRKLGVNSRSPLLIKTIQHGGYWFAPDVTVEQPAG
jgi:two-component system OmpR family response regulator